MSGYTPDDDDRFESAMARLHDTGPTCEAPWCRDYRGATHFATFTTGVQRRVCEGCARELPRLNPGVTLEPIASEAQPKIEPVKPRFQVIVRDALVRIPGTGGRLAHGVSESRNFHDEAEAMAWAEERRAKIRGASVTIRDRASEPLPSPEVRS